MSSKKAIEKLTDLIQKTASMDDLFNHFDHFLRDPMINEEEKLSFVLIGFYYQINHPIPSWARQLSPQHHHALSNLVFLSDAVFDEQGREELALYVALILLFQSLKGVLFAAKNDPLDNQQLVDYFLNLATFRSFLKIQDVLSYHQGLLEPFVGESIIESDSVIRADEDDVLGRMTQLFHDSPKLLDFLSQNSIMSAIGSDAWNPVHSAWIHSAVQGLFDLLTSEDQMAFLSLFSQKWIPLYRRASTELNDLIEALLEGLKMLKDIPASILEDVFTTLNDLGNQLIKNRVNKLRERYGFATIIS